jgi:hypothetical protein
MKIAPHWYPTLILAISVRKAIPHNQMQTFNYRLLSVPVRNLEILDNPTP